MKKKFENIIKNNSYINKIYTFLGSNIMILLGYFVKKEENTMLFVSYMGKNYNDSPKMIYDSLVDDPQFKNYTFIWAFNEPQKYDIEDKKTKKVKMDSFQYLLTALKVDYWVTNVNIERGLHFKKSYTKSINTWHGVPLKKIGNDVKGRNDFDFSNTNLFCYSSVYEYEIYKDAFKLNDANLYKIGMPRNDLVLENNQKLKEKVRKKLNIKNKKVILYAPTWRDNSNDLKLMDLKKWEKALADDYVLLIKTHSLGEKFNLDDSEFVIDVNDYEETAELIIAADLLITDYSSIMFDFSLLAKPVFLYTPDYESYARERGLYFDLKETQLSIFEEEEELLKHLLNFDFKTEEKISKVFGEHFIEVRKPTSTKKIIELIKEGKT